MTFLSHGKTGKHKNICRKLQKLESYFEKLRKTGKHPKDNEKWRKPGKQEKKLRKAGKASNLSQNAGNGPPIIPLVTKPRFKISK